jgi:hypothetical protein
MTTGGFGQEQGAGRSEAVQHITNSYRLRSLGSLRRARLANASRAGNLERYTALS